MSGSLSSVKQLYVAYKRWISENPQFVSDIETTAKWISYFIAGRISTSSVISELIYSLSNILVLFNDRIIENANSTGIGEKNGDRLKMLLTTLEYSEVFIEISAKKLYGNRGRWLFVIIIQSIKFLGRYLLLTRFSADIIRVPPIPVLDRKNVQKRVNEMGTICDEFQENSFYFKLKRSGRIVRKVEGAAPLQMRNWKPLQNELDTANNHSIILKTAEGLYIAKPLVHLAAIGLFGYRSWKSFGTSILIDLASIRMYYNNRESLTDKQKVELSRRCVNLLLYLVRSPFYERVSANRITRVLEGISNNIPLAKSLCRPLIHYIPQWQDTYFYMWSS